MVIISLPLASSHFRGRKSWATSGTQTKSSARAIRFMAVILWGCGVAGLRGFVVPPTRNPATQQPRNSATPSRRAERDGPHQHAEVARVGAEVLPGGVERAVDGDLEDVRRAVGRRR